MALSDKNIIITPNIGSSSDPKIVFSGADASTTAQNITLSAYPTSNGTLSFDGSAGQLFSITNSLSGSIFSVNDVSGIPSIEVLDTGNIKLAQYGGNIGIGTSTIASRLSIKGTTATDAPTLGTELLTGGTWTSTGWTGNNTTGWINGASNATALSYSVSSVIGTKYQIAYTVTGYSAGSFTVAFGGQSLAGITATGAFGPTSTSLGTLIVTPTSTFVGTIVLSIKAITAASTALITALDSTGASKFEVRASSALYNTFLGVGSGRYNTTGYSNSAVGVASLYSNTTGVSNSAVGLSALYSNTTGYSNSAVGVASLYSNTTGSNNSAVGLSALNSNTTGSNNSAVGTSALNSNTTGSNNSAVGLSALNSNTTGSNNSAVGLYALYYNTTGSGNSAVGYGALNYNTIASQNSAFGYQALYASLGGNNSAFGYWALRSNTLGNANTAIGMSALVGLTSAVATLGTVTGGSGYTTPGTYTGVQLTYLSGTAVSPIGSYPIATIVVAGGVVTTVTLTSYGVGFKDTTTVMTCAAASIGGGGSGFSVPVATLATGTSNTALGASAGSAITTGSNNVIIGGYSGAAAPISATGSNYVVLSDGAGNVRQVIDSSGNVGIGNTPSGTYKLQVTGAISGTTLTSTIATGTAPFTVTSTTPVTNLSIGGNAATVTTIPTLSGEVSNSSNSITLSNSAVIGKVLTAYASSTGTISATDSILTAIQKLNGNTPIASSTTPAALGTAAVGTGTTFARADHVHASPTTVSGNAGTATSLTGGSIGTIPYQSSANTTAMLAVGTAGQALVSAAGAAPTWTTLTLENLPDAWVKKSCACATTAALTINTAQTTIDGVTLTATSRVLVKDQAAPAQNGIYTGLTTTTWVRATDADTISELAGAAVNVDGGTVNGGKVFDTDLKSTDTLGTTAVTFYNFLDSSALSSTTPATIGTAAVGTGTTLARSDHVHAMGNLTGDVTSVGLATTLTNAPVIAKVLTGYVSGAGTVSATDSILGAIQKLNGNTPIASSTTPAALGVAAVGTGTTWARADHVHQAPTTITGNAATATTATNIAGGVANKVPYQTAAGTTAFVPVSTAAGQVLTTAAAGGAPTWVTPTAITLSSAITGYVAGANTALAATDTILAAFGKLQGQVTARGVGTVTGVTGTAPVSSSGGTAPVISMAAATASVNGYMSTTYAAKLDGFAYGSVGEIGRYLDFHGTLGTANDYDVRLDCGVSGVAAAGILTITAGGGLVCNANITAYSDERLKENINVIPNSLEKVKSLRGVTFTRNDLADITKLHTGVIAQEVLKVLPEAVSQNEEGIYSVAYGNMVGLLIEAIKEQQVQIDELKQTINKGN